MHTTSTRLAAAALAGLALVATTTTAAQAKGDDAVRRSGTCSGSTHWKLKAKADDGQVETEYEVDSNKNGQVWKVTLRHDGDVAFTGRRTTQAPSGSFSVERRLPDHAGADVVRASARNVDTGERCSGTLTFKG